nr:MAG TPA: hypothetical protein [Caudoviricetes sp.]
MLDILSYVLYNTRGGNKVGQRRLAISERRWCL